MYRKPKWNLGTLEVNESMEGESIEEKVSRVVNNKEPIKDGAPIIHMEKSKGVLPEYDVRTDRFDVALNAMDRHSRAKAAKSEPALDDNGNIIPIRNEGEQQKTAEE